jgi:drug/metabolite transporter (DMT)-like permease
MMHTRNERIGFLCLLVAIGLWSTVEVVVRSLHEAIPPIQFAWVRFMLGGVFLLTLLPMELKRRRLRLNRRIVLFSLWSSIPGIAVSSMALQFGLTYAGAAVIATVYGAAPLIVMGLSRVMLGDRMTRPRVVGLVCGFLGILLLASGKPSPTFSLVGVGCALLSVGTFSLWAVLVKKYAGDYGGLPVTALSFFFGVLFMTPLMLWESGGVTLAPLLAHPGAVLYLSLGTTGIAYWCYFMGLGRVDATRAMSIILLKPPAAALLATWALAEPLTWNVIASMVMILASLYGVILWDRPAVAPVRPMEISSLASRHDDTEEHEPCPKQTMQ